MFIIKTTSYLFDYSEGTQVLFMYMQEHKKLPNLHK